MGKKSRIPPLVWHLLAIVIILGWGTWALRNSLKERRMIIGAQFEELAKIAAQMLQKDMAINTAQTVALACSPDFEALPDAAARRNFLLKKSSDAPGVRWGEADLAGNANMTDGRKISVAAFPAFQKAREGQSAFSVTDAGRIGADVAFVTYAPFYSRGKVSGVLLAAHTSAALQKMLQEFTWAPKGYAFVIGHDGVMIAHADERLVQKTITRNANTPEGNAFPQLTALEERMRKGESGYGTYVYNAENKIMGFAPVAGMEWSVAVTGPQKEAFSPINDLLTLIDATFFGAIVVLLIYIVHAFRLQKQHSAMSQTLEDKFAELYVAHERLTATEKELERQLEETKSFANRLHTTEERLQVGERNRAELYQIVNASPVALVVIDDNLQHILNCNDTAVRMFAVQDRKQFMENFRHYLPEKQHDGQNTTEYLASSLNTSRQNRGGDFECDFVDNNGDPLPLWVSHRFLEINGQFLRLTYLQDMRRIRRAQEIMRTRQEEMELLIANLPVAVEILDAKTFECIFVNQAFLQMTGYSDLAARRKHFSCNTAARQQDGCESDSKFAEIVEKIRKEKAAAFSWELTRFDGTLIEVDAFSQLIRYQYQECILTVFHDISADRENANLLLNSLESSSSLNAMRERFLHKFSREVQEPVTAILTQAERFALPEPEMAALRNEVGKLRKLTSQLLNNQLNLDVSEPAAAPEVPTVPADKPLPHDVSILLAEDNSVNRLAVRELLRMRGYRCDEVEDGEAAVEAVRAKPYDVVLMDINMPRLDGDIATRCIRDFGYKMPIIAITSDPTAEERRAYTAAGITDLIEKPIVIDDLLTLLKEVLPQ